MGTTVAVLEDKSEPRKRATRSKGNRDSVIQNAVISERVKKCGRIKAPFAPGGPEDRAANVFGGKSREVDETVQGPAVIGSAYL